MMYKSAFLSSAELRCLIQSVRQNYDPRDNVIELNNIDSIKDKIAAQIKQEFGVDAEFMMAYLFLACETTMQRFDSTQGWHTDGSCTYVDGDCFNAWLPIYIDSVETGMEIIPQSQNELFYQQVGDRTKPLDILNKTTEPGLFELIGAPEECDQIVINQFSGKVLPYSKNQLNVVTIEKPQVGDLCLFKQADLHRGFHRDGVRIQLSLKFISSEASLNQKSTNKYYQLFESLSGGGDIHQFLTAKRQLDEKRSLSKHGRLEAILIKSLLNQQLATAD